jgi:hypothetical protein
MYVRLIHVDLLEASQPLTHPLCALPDLEKAKTALEFDIVFERNLRAGKKTDRDVWFSHSCETSRDRVGKLRCHQLVSNFRRSASNVVQTVVTH